MNPVPADLAIVVCAYTEARWIHLARCVASLQLQTLPPAEILVVIDHNRTLFELATATFAGVRVLENSDEQGLSGARNTGIRNSSAPIVAFIDDDAVADPNWVRELAAPFADASIMAVGGHIAPLWESSLPRWMPPEFYWVIGCSYRGMPVRVAPIRNVIGANMAFRRDVFRTVGLFRNGIGRQGERPLGCEETELSIRARHNLPDRHIVLAPAAVVHHLIPTKRTRFGYFARRCYAEGLSKATVSTLVGTADGLASERTFTRVTLPRGVRTGIADTLLRGDPTGVARSIAIVSGLFLTIIGYVRGRVGATSIGAYGERAPTLVAE